LGNFTEMTHRRCPVGKAKATAVAAFLGVFIVLTRNTRRLLQICNATPWARSGGGQEGVARGELAYRVRAKAAPACRFKADGPGWQARMDELLKKAAGL